MLENIYMNKSLLQSFIELVSRRIGLHIRAQEVENFQSKLLLRLKLNGLAMAEDYFQLLASDSAESKVEWQKLAVMLTTGESYFFRDKQQLELIRKRVLPTLISKNEPNRTLRIWSAGCATGEETYSIAIILDELLAGKANWDIFILGTDINGEALAKAAKGSYTPWSFRMVDPDLQKRYFRQQKDMWVLDERIRKMVTFSKCNLVEDAFPSWESGRHTMDLILCRNVFIYFQPETTSRVVEKFIGTLNESGYLITGHGELSANDSKKFLNRIFHDQVFYQKSSDHGLQAAELMAAEKAKATQTPVQPSKLKTPKKSAVKEARNPKQESKIGSSAAQSPEPRERRPDISLLQTLLENGNYTAAIETARTILREDPQNSGAHLQMAQAYANTGDYDKAERHCRSALEIAPTTPDPYFLFAQLYEAKGDNDAAKTYLKKALYIKPDFIAAFLELGELYHKEADFKRAKKMYSTALELISLLPTGASLSQYGSISAGELLSHVTGRLAGLTDN